MVGFYATADSSKPIRTDLDNELEDARWFTRQEILDVLSHPDGTNLSKRLERTPGGGGGALAHSDPGTQNPAEQNAAHAAKQNETSLDDVASSESKPLQFVVPPKTAIAGVLISEWAHGRITHLPPAANQRGNL
jgi:NAD+ diphosphatase